MTHIKESGRRLNVTMAAVWIIVGLISSGPGIAYSHGGKTHGGESFTAFQAIQKSTALYDRLIASGKLPEAWETDLSSIHVAVRGAEDSREIVVRFKRSTGQPDVVYFYFNRQGDYTGSNFTGN